MVVDRKRGTLQSSNHKMRWPTCPLEPGLATRYTCSVILAHNLCRDLQVLTQAPRRSRQPRRAAPWEFMEIDTIRQRFVRQAGRLIRPQGELSLSMNVSKDTESALLPILDAIDQGA